MAELAEIELSDDKITKLKKITEYNIKAKYPDQKRVFRKKCTKDFAQNEIKDIGGIFVWLKSLIQI